MSVPPQYDEIIDDLIEATEYGKVKWVKLPSDELSLSMPDGSFCMWDGFDDTNLESFIGVGIRLSDGSLLDSFSCVENEPSYERVRNLYFAGRRSANNVDQRLSSLKDMLKKLNAEAHS